MANGVSPGPGIPPTPLPGWLGSAVQITTQVGVPTVFAGFLLWFVLMRVGGTLEMMQKAEDDRIRIVNAMQDTLVATLNRQTEQFVAVMEKNIQTNKDIAAELRGQRRNAQ